MAWDRWGYVPDPRRGASLAMPGHITQQADVTPAGTVPACSNCPPPYQAQNTLIIGKMCHGEESSGHLLLRLGRGVSLGPWTALLTVCLSVTPWVCGPREFKVSRDKQSSCSPCCGTCLEHPQKFKLVWGGVWQWTLVFYVTFPWQILMGCQG